MTCADLQTLFHLREGELSERAAAELREHLGGCARCAAESRRLDRLSSAIAGDVPAAAAVSVEQVMAALSTSVPRPPPVRARWVISAMAASMLAAVGVSVAVEKHAVVAARGAAPAGDALDKHVGVTVLAGEPLAPLTAATTVPAATGFSLAWRNLLSGDAFAMVFIVDSRGEMHWVYPAYTDTSQDPVSVRLTPASSDQVMPDSARFDDLASGAAKVVTVISAQPLKVKDVEAGITPAGALVRSLPFTVR